MDAFIASLPQNKTYKTYELYIYDERSNEGNVCTKSQVASAKTKGWTPYYYDSTKQGWYEYEGSVGLTEKRAEAEAVYQAAVSVYEQYMVYYEGEGMAYCQQLMELADANEKTAMDLYLHIELLIEKMASTSGMDDIIAVMMIIKEDVLASEDANKDAQNVLNAFYNSVQEHFEFITAYSGRLAQYKERLESATTTGELETLIAEMSKDAEETKATCLDPVVSDYETLKAVEELLYKISQKLYSAQDITGVSSPKNIDADTVTVYTLDGKRQVMKKADLKLLPKGLYIINGQKVTVK